MPTIATTSSADGARSRPSSAARSSAGVDQHNVIDGAIILNNTTAGKLNLGVPMLSVGQDDTLQIKGDIFGEPEHHRGQYARSTRPSGRAGRPVDGRFLTTAILGGGALNSSSGIIILSGQVKDTPSGATRSQPGPLRTC